jgi:hypothetical protein
MPASDASSIAVNTTIRGKCLFTCIPPRKFSAVSVTRLGRISPSFAPVSQTRFLDTIAGMFAFIPEDKSVRPALEASPDPERDPVPATVRGAACCPS